MAVKSELISGNTMLRLGILIGECGDVICGSLLMWCESDEVCFRVAQNQTRTFTASSEKVRILVRLPCRKNILTGRV